MKYYFLLILFNLSNLCICQTNDSIINVSLQSITVTSYKEKPFRETSLNISSLNIDSLRNDGNFNLTDLIAKTPGVSMLSTGVAIAKPVIRGLYGNRILVLLSGLKFDNQQWQEEHGMGLSDLGLSKVEIIKGPLSVLYGSESIGGIINSVEEEKADIQSQVSDISLKFNSNTLGGLIQAGYKINYGQKWWRIRIGMESNADYSDGKNHRILNSRFDGYHLKASFGFQKNNWTSNTNFLSSFNRFGFIYNDIYNFITPDARWSRNLGVNPAHLVLLNILSSDNQFKLKNKSTLNFNIGVQSNDRMENEGGGKISLNMHLLTIQYLLKWEKRLSQINRIILSNLGSFEVNKNFGSRKIIPDANMQESNVSLFLETNLSDKLTLENGIGFGEKYIKTFLTPSVNGPEKDIHPFSKFSTYYNLFSGITYYPNNNFNVKLNVATGVRVANLAELSSNGLHEGVFNYEIGDPSLKNEQIISLNLHANYTNKLIGFSISPFYNYFYNYIFLAPTNEDWFGSPIFRYKQQSAKQYGTELTIMANPTEIVHTEFTYSGMISKTEDGNYTPFIPAQKITSLISFKLNLSHIQNSSAFCSYEYFSSQNLVAPFEISTPQYGLWNLGLSSYFKYNRYKYSICLVANNILNTPYYDHLSRFKIFGLLNIGRNVTLNFKINLVEELSKK